MRNPFILSIDNREISRHRSLSAALKRAAAENTYGRKVVVQDGQPNVKAGSAFHWDGEGNVLRKRGK